MLLQLERVPIGSLEFLRRFRWRVCALAPLFYHCLGAARRVHQQKGTLCGGVSGTNSVGAVAVLSSIIFGAASFLHYPSNDIRPPRGATHSRISFSIRSLATPSPSVAVASPSAAKHPHCLSPSWWCVLVTLPSQQLGPHMCGTSRRRLCSWNTYQPNEGQVARGHCYQDAAINSH